MTDTINISTLNKATFEILFKENFERLCFFAKKYVNDVDSAKEIVHDVFINLWEKRDSIDPGKSVKSYLYTSVNNRCLNYIRDNKKFDKENTEIEMLSESKASEFSDTLEHEELKFKISKSIDSLPEKTKKIFEMSRFEELKYSEIAEKLDISIKTVEAQMSKALKVLRESLKEYLPIIIIFFSFFVGVGGIYVYNNWVSCI